MAVSLTPDAQLRAMDLLDRWGVFASLAILILVIYRKEIGMLVLSFKREHNADALLNQMVGAFDKNLVIIERTEKATESILKSLDDQVDVMRGVLTVLQEMRVDVVRRNGK